MRSHDVLEISVFADSKQIENAYSAQMNALIKNGYDKTYPVLYARKVNELKKAKEECLKYIGAPIMKKAELELQDCADKVYSPNVLHSWCWAGETCGTCCLVSICVFMVFGIISGIVATHGDDISYRIRKLQEAVLDERISRLERRNEEERETGIRLSNELMRVRAQLTETISNQKILSTRINEIESGIRIVNSFLEDAGVMVDLKETEGHRLLLRQIQDTESECNRLNSRIDSIQEELNTISQHEQELVEARNARNRRS